MTITMSDVAKLDRDTAFDFMLSRTIIQELIARYSRGLDRCDPDIITSLFWPEGGSSLFEGTVTELAEHGMAVLKTMERTMHMLGNCVIEFDDADHARSETYLVAWHDIKGPLNETNLVAGGRYLDTFERRSGEWRFLRRTHVSDWHQMQLSTMHLSNELTKQVKDWGGRFPNDPAYGFLKSPVVGAEAALA